MKTPQQIVDAWNEKYPVGTTIRYLDSPGIEFDNGELIAVTTRPAVVIGDNLPALWVRGCRGKINFTLSGCLELRLCEPVGGDQ